MHTIIIRGSSFQFRAIVMFYGILLYFVVDLLWLSPWRMGIFLSMTMIGYELKRILHYVMSGRGPLVLIPSARQLYWKKERWRLHSPPLFMFGTVLLNMASLRSGKKICLILCHDQTDPIEWRKLHYFLRQRFLS